MTHRTTLAFSYWGHSSLHPCKYLRCNLSSDCSSVLLLSKLTLSSSTELPSSSMRTFPSSRFLSLMMPDCYARCSTSVSAPSSSWTATRGCCWLSCWIWNSGSSISAISLVLTLLSCFSSFRWKLFYNWIRGRMQWQLEEIESAFAWDFPANMSYHPGGDEPASCDGNRQPSLFHQF